MELRDYVRLLQRRWWVLVVCVVLGFVGANTATNHATKVYGSSVTFFLSDSHGHAVSSLVASESQTVLASYTSLLSSDAVDNLVHTKANIPSGYTSNITSIVGTTLVRVDVTADTPLKAQQAALAYGSVIPGYLLDFGGDRPGTTTLSVLQRPKLNPTLLSPHPTRNKEIGSGLGLLVGIGILLLIEALDNRIRDTANIEKMTGVGIAAAIPREFRGQQLITETKPRSQRAEAIRLVRTNVQFAGIGGPLRTLVVTSARAGEGKTSVATDLALAHAQSGQSVILLDADLRKPRVARVFKLKSEPGLSNVLVGQATLASALHTYGEGQLKILTAGTRPSNPSELLASGKMNELLTVLRDHCDIVIIDSAPVLPVADTTAMLPYADAVLVVTRVGSTTTSQLTSTIRRLNDLNARVVGIVANGSKAGISGGGYYDEGGRLRRLFPKRTGAYLQVPVSIVTDSAETTTSFAFPDPADEPLVAKTDPDTFNSGQAAPPAPPVYQDADASGAALAVEHPSQPTTVDEGIPPLRPAQVDPEPHTPNDRPGFRSALAPPVPATARIPRPKPLHRMERVLEQREAALRKLDELTSPFPHGLPEPEDETTAAGRHLADWDESAVEEESEPGTYHWGRPTAQVDLRSADRIAADSAVTGDDTSH